MWGSSPQRCLVYGSQLSPLYRIKQIQGTKPNKSVSLTTPHLIITFSPRPSIEGRGEKSPSSADTRKDERTCMVERGGSLSWGMYRKEGREEGRKNGIRRNDLRVSELVRGCG